MAIEMIVIFGVVFAATTIAVLVHDYRMDVLHGPYIDGLDRRSDVSMQRLALSAEKFPQARGGTVGVDTTLRKSLKRRPKLLA